MFRCLTCKAKLRDPAAYYCSPCANQWQEQEDAESWQMSRLNLPWAGDTCALCDEPLADSHQWFCPSCRRQALIEFREAKTPELVREAS